MLQANREHLFLAAPDSLLALADEAAAEAPVRRFGFRSRSSGRLGARSMSSPLGEGDEEIS
jgi:hypothetical protein